MLRRLGNARARSVVDVDMNDEEQPPRGTGPSVPASGTGKPARRPASPATRATGRRKTGRGIPVDPAPSAADATHAKPGSPRRGSDGSRTDNDAPGAGSSAADTGAARGREPTPAKRVPETPTRAPTIEAGGAWEQSGMVRVKLVYAAYLTSPALPVAALAGAAFAFYARRRQPPAWLASHYHYQIRTFWGALAGYVCTWALSFAGAGLIVYPLVAVWVVARSVHGIVRAAHARPIDDPDAFLV